MDIENELGIVIFDEIHMIGKEEGYAMEYIIKLLPTVNFLALSATISNTDEIIEWLEKISLRKISKIICSKRFFNLQKYYYNNSTNEFIILHPLALITEEQIKDKSLLNKSLQPTPPDCWNLVSKLKIYFDLEELDPYIYFKNINRIELDDVNTYFNKLIIFIVDNYENNKDKIMDIINLYKHETLIEEQVNLIQLAFKLKHDNKNPTIIFQKNTNKCLKLVREFIKDIENMENKKYPRLLNERIKFNKKNEKLLEKKNKNAEIENSKKEIKQMLNEENDNNINLISIQEPHSDFIFNDTQYFSQPMIESWVNNLKKYFPNDGFYYHYIIKLLWRGIGIYVKTLPDPYLRLVQTLACNKQLSIVFSDLSLVFGISMPFRTVVILNDDINSMEYNQMAGRSGRRGLDKEGNVIFVGFSWDRIKELSISEHPIISGINKEIYTLPHVTKISNNYNWNNIIKNFLDKTIDEEEYINYINYLNSNYNNSWRFSLDSNDPNFLHMNWKLRHNNECLIISYLIPYLRRAFESLDHTQEINQISIAHFLCSFISIYQTPTNEDILVKHQLLNEYPYNKILSELDNLQINIINNVDNKIFLSIRNNILENSLFECENLNERLFKFGETIKIIQHYCYYSKILGLCRLLGKLLTRIWWIYHLGSPIMKPIKNY